MSVLPAFSHSSMFSSATQVEKASERFIQQFQHCLQVKSLGGILNGLSDKVTGLVRFLYALCPHPH